MSSTDLINILSTFSLKSFIQKPPTIWSRTEPSDAFLETSLQVNIGLLIKRLKWEKWDCSLTANPLINTYMQNRDSKATLKNKPCTQACTICPKPDWRYYLVLRICQSQVIGGKGDSIESSIQSWSREQGLGRSTTGCLLCWWTTQGFETLKLLNIGTI